MRQRETFRRPSEGRVDAAMRRARTQQRPRAPNGDIVHVEPVIPVSTTLYRFVSMVCPPFARVSHHGGRSDHHESTEFRVSRAA